MNKATISTWAVDAFLGLSSSRGIPLEWSSEWISRAGNFVESFVLYDKIVLTEEFLNNSILNLLDPDGKIFEYIKMQDLIHTINLKYGITIDLSLNLESYEALEKEGSKWFVQHDGFADESDYNDLLREGGPSMTLVRLWQHSLTNEIAEKTHSSLILPLSLQGLQKTKAEQKFAPYHVEQFQALSNHYHSAVKSVVTAVGEPFEGVIENMPPFFSLLIDQTLSVDMLVENLICLRRDYQELRGLTGKLKREIDAQQGVSAKSEVVADWAKSWDLVVKNGFKKPSLLRRKISSADFSKAIVKPAAAISTVVQAVMDHSEEAKSYKRFAVYGNVYEELESAWATEEKLKQNLNVNINRRLRL